MKGELGKHMGWRRWMGEMVERVARALFAKRNEAVAGHSNISQYEWEDENQPYREFVLSEARAVLVAIREPRQRRCWRQASTSASLMARSKRMRCAAGRR